MQPLFSFLTLISLFLVFPGKASADAIRSYEVNVEMDLIRELDHKQKYLSGREHIFFEILKRGEKHYVVRLVSSSGKGSKTHYLVNKDVAEQVIRMEDEKEEKELAELERQNMKEWQRMLAKGVALNISDEINGNQNTSKTICSLYTAFKSKISEKSAKIALQQVLSFYANNQDDFANKRYVGFADYSQSSTKKRFYLLDMVTGSVTQEKVSHGVGLNHQGDPEHDGFLKRCSLNGIHTNFTRAGFFRVANYYLSANHVGKWPMLVDRKNGMRLEGLSSSNKEALAQGVVMHEAYYNQGNIMGRSYGCPAFPPGKGAPIIAKLKGGGLYYSYTPVCKPEYAQVMNQISDWDSFCKGAGNDQGDGEDE